MHDDNQRERQAGGSDALRLERPGGHLACLRRAGRGDARGPGLLYLGGLRSSMESAKALALDAHCAAAGRPLVRFDYTGHGRSSGRFEDGTIGGWTGDALAVLDRASEGPQILVGSSMGGWIALLAALRRPERIAGLLLVGPAVDFTEFVVNRLFGEEQRRQLGEAGRVEVPDCHGGPPFAITRRLIEEARDHLLLPRSSLPIQVPVRLIHGQRDRDAPWQTSLRLAELIEGPDVRTVLVKDGGHELSRPGDLTLMTTAVEELGRAVR